MSETTSHHKETVAILDCGAQYAKVIDRRIRELNIETQILPISTKAQDLEHFSALIISGGPESIYTKTITYDEKIFTLGRPVLGICFGMQMMAHVNGGIVEKKSQREDGVFKISVDTTCKLFEGMEPQQNVLLTHGDSVIQVPTNYRAVGHSGDIISAIANEKDRLYGVQFHPEVDLTENGIQLFKNFLFKPDIAGLKGTFTLPDRKTRAIEYIKSRVGNKKVLVLASGGVDSTVCAALLHEALEKDRVIALHVNNGFMRKNESALVEKALSELGLHLLNVDASEDFYNATTEITTPDNKTYTTKKLKEVIHPEEKRKIIGDTFMRIAQREISKLGLVVENVILAQGTLRPDIIESGSPDVSKTAHTIKTHHNDTNLVRQLRASNSVVEPLSDYHKDEVRRLGKGLGLPEAIVMRQPFPGPGLAVRILCCEQPDIDELFDSTNDFLKALLADNQSKYENNIQLNLKDYERPILEEIRKQNQINAIILPIKSVGVQGDGRSYNYPCGLTMKEPINWDHLFMLARLIPRISHNINRVVYIFGSDITEPVKTVTPTTMTPNVIKLLQEVDDVATSIITKSGSLEKISQVPIILIPVSFGKAGATHSITIRTIITNDFMTGRAAIPGSDISISTLNDIVHQIQSKFPEISRILYDLTSKPPGTTEWE